MTTDNFVRYRAVALLAFLFQVCACVRSCLLLDDLWLFVTFKVLLLYIAKTSFAFIRNVLKSRSHVNRIQIVHITWQLCVCVVNFVLLNALWIYERITLTFCTLLIYVRIVIISGTFILLSSVLSYLHTYLLHGAESSLRS
jgi:hypothetical protein